MWWCQNFPWHMSSIYRQKHAHYTVRPLSSLRFSSSQWWSRSSKDQTLNRWMKFRHIFLYFYWINHCFLELIEQNVTVRHNFVETIAGKKENHHPVKIPLVAHQFELFYNHCCNVVILLFTLYLIMTVIIKKNIEIQHYMM